MTKLLVFAAIFAVSALLAVSPALGASKLQVTTSEQVHIGASSGTFTFSGDVSDGGAFVFNAFLSAGPPAFFLSTEHIVETYLGSAGSLTVQKECLTVYIGGGLFSDTCQAVVLAGTGAYEDEHGAGSCSGLINLVTGIASQTCDLRLN
jgi:hypothetical protein